MYLTIDKLSVAIADLWVIVRESAMLRDDRFTHLDDRQLGLAEAQATTDDRLNALITVVEKHITGPDHAPRA